MQGNEEVEDARFSFIDLISTLFLVLFLFFLLQLPQIPSKGSLEEALCLKPHLRYMFIL